MLPMWGDMTLPTRAFASMPTTIVADGHLVRMADAARASSRQICTPHCRRRHEAGGVGRDDGDRQVASKPRRDRHDAGGDGGGHDHFGMYGLLDPDLRAVGPVGGARDVHVVGGAGADLV
eukprot:16307839-Heterocapsa_arctica.AAC.1